MPVIIELEDELPKLSPFQAAKLPDKERIEQYAIYKKMQF